MNNIERAARAIAESACRELAQPDDIIPYLTQRNLTRAQHLAAEGLLMPDLPEPDWFCEWGIDPLVVRIDTVTNQVCLEDSDVYQGSEIYMSPDEAREAAFALLAAADYAERNQE